MQIEEAGEKISLRLLDHLSRTKANHAALGSQAMFYLQGIGIPQDLKKGRTCLLVAARSCNRISAARLAVYYQGGRYGFKKDEEKASFWRDRVTQWLISDAALIYDNSSLKQLACDQLKRWEFTCQRIWGYIPNIELTQLK